MKRLLLTAILTLLLANSSWAIDEPQQPLNIDPTTHHFGWKVTGAAPIAPSLVFDNGRKVYLKFREDAEIPTIFVETSQGLILLNWVSEPPYIVVPNIKGALRLRLDGNETRITKKGYFNSPQPLLVADVREALKPDPTAKRKAAAPKIVNKLNQAPEKKVVKAEPRPVSITDSLSVSALTEESFKAKLTPDPVPNSSLSASTKSILAAYEEHAKIAPAIPVVKAPEVWQVSEKTLKDTVIKWTNRANWHLEWMQDDLDYPISVPFSLQGSFTEAITKLFDLYADARRPFKVWLQENQHVIVVNERKRK